MFSAFPNYAHSANLPFRKYVIKQLVTHTMDPYDGDASMEIRQLQERDQDLVKVRDWFSKNKRSPFHKIRNHGYVIKSLWSQWNDLILKNGIL